MTYDEAVTELLRLANAQMRLVGKPPWTRQQVITKPADASWCGHAYSARLRQIVEAGGS